LGLREHRSRAPKSARVFVVTLSDTRDASNDQSGDTIRDALTKDGHVVVGRSILREDPDRLAEGFDALLLRDDIDAIVVSGGTGIAPRDRAYDLLARRYERVLPGFGELFRALSYAEIGSAAMASRASAGVSSGKLVFSLPGSRAAVRLALDKLILPELGHLVGEMRAPATPGDAP
jgi:molybdenum cofactor biosynthesis protein B